MATKIQEKAKCLQEKIQSERYYIDLYRNALKQNLMTEEGITACEYQDKRIVIMANDFWLALPESLAVHRFPFALLCEIAEEIFG